MSGSEVPLLRVRAVGEASDPGPLAPSGYPGFQATTYASRSYTGLAPGYTYQFPGKSGSASLLPACPRFPGSVTPQGGVWGCMAGAGGLPAGRLEGRACLRKEHLSPPPPPPPQELGAVPSQAGLLSPPRPTQGCHFHHRGHWAWVRGRTGVSFWTHGQCHVLR